MRRSRCGPVSPNPGRVARRRAIASRRSPTISYLRRIAAASVDDRPSPSAWERAQAVGLVADEGVAMPRRMSKELLAAIPDE